MIGPKVQDDLLDIVQRFRLHRIVMSADVAKMYRQVWVHPDDREFCGGRHQINQSSLTS